MSERVARYIIRKLLTDIKELLGQRSHAFSEWTDPESIQLAEWYLSQKEVANADERKG